MKRKKLGQRQTQRDKFASFREKLHNSFNWPQREEYLIHNGTFGEANSNVQTEINFKSENDFRIVIVERPWRIIVG